MMKIMGMLPPTEETIATIANAAAGTPGADDWQVELLHDNEAQLYLIGQQVESQRTVTNERAVVTLYNDHTPGSQTSESPEAEIDFTSGLPTVRGFSTLTLLASDLDDGQLSTRLADGVTAASLTDNPPFGLPEAPAGGYPRVAALDPLLANDPEAALDDVRARLTRAVSNWGNVRLSSAELFATRSSRLLRNSRNLAAASRSTQIFLDFVLIAEVDGREAEFHAELTRRRISDLMVESTVDSYATYARHLLMATPPSTHCGPVILTGDALLNLFSPVIFHASGQAAFMKLSRFKPGESVTVAPPGGDRLTLFSDALCPFGVKTAAFDGEGLPGKRVTLIEDGVFMRNWAGTRYATYLGIPPSGDFANLTIEPGQWEMDELRSANGGPIYEIMSLSLMNPDPVSGDFTVEIKLGYRHDATGTHPIKGGSVSGNIFAALADARFSSQTYSDGYYYGPAGIRFGNLTISGD
ncbi:MAG: metallopeptidase TldD-related protein [Ktedonobacterales bacterium]